METPDPVAANALHWPPRHKRDLIEHAKLAYEAHGRVMAENYPHLAPQTPWDDQDAAVREAWIEHVTPEGGTPVPSRRLLMDALTMIGRGAHFEVAAERLRVGPLTINLNPDRTMSSAEVRAEAIRRSTGIRGDDG